MNGMLYSSSTGIMIAMFLVRITLGFIFVAHGLQKVFGLFGGQGIQAFAGWIASMGYPLWLGYVAALFELIGGIMLLLGIAPEFGALMILPVMIGAIVMVHSSGFFLQQNGCEYALTLAILCVVVIMGGAGSWALWNPCKRSCNKNSCETIQR